MVCVLIISVLSCGGMVAATLFKPKVTVKGVSLGTYWLVTCLGAAALLALRLISFDEVFRGLTANSAINPLKILVLFISMTVLSIFLDETGFFKFLANAVVKRAGAGQFKPFTYFYLMVSALTVFTSNDIVILTFTPFICYYAKNARVNPIPYLVSEFVAANTASMLLIIGNPTNIYLAASNGVDFIEYIKVMATPTLLAVITAYLVMLLIFYKQLKKPLVKTCQDITIGQKPLLIVGIALLSLCTVMLVISSYINLEMWLIAGMSAAALIVAVLLLSAFKRRKPKELANSFKRAPWELVPFIISMFVIIFSLEKYALTEKLAVLLEGGNVVFKYGGTSVIFANLVNNIPMSVLFSSVIQNINSGGALPAVYAVIIGSNIGAYLTPVGALAGIMWLSILKKNDVNYSFMQFCKYGVIIALPVMLAALGGLLLVI